MITTPTGVPYIDCDVCGTSHPQHRRHCTTCNRPSLFIDPAGTCGRCADKKETRR